MGGTMAKKPAKKGKKKHGPKTENQFLVPRNPGAERENRGHVKAVPVKITPPEEKEEPPKYSRGRKVRGPGPKGSMDDRISRLGTEWGRRKRKPKKKKKG
ncbi:hypothetical protein GF415_03530 [Candidatus Micrarchaeota archaeon]|nr:hypothetical protein [Candidatus Micrarchaeota archaeon]